jgi:hypothetical protein
MPVAYLKKIGEVPRLRVQAEQPFKQNAAVAERSHAEQLQ